ncbi:hypothetical protein ES703_14350 [subsurface metagenome]
MAAVLGAMVKGLLNVEGMNMDVIGDDIVYTVEVDSVISGLAPIKAKLAMLFDLPLKWGHVEEVNEVVRGVLVKAYKVKVLIPKSEFAHRETRIRKMVEGRR